MQKNKRKIIFWVILILVIALVIFRVASAALADTAPIVDETANVRITNAVMSNLESTSPLTGRIQPVEEVNLIPKLAGEVTKVYVALGDKVEKGALLYTLDGTQMQSSLSQANAGLSSAKANYNSAKETFDSLSVLYAQGAVSKQQYDQAKLGLDSASAGLTQAKAGVSMAADGASNTRITAPISGYVTAVNIVEGGIASQAMAAVSIANIDVVEIDCSVAENLINKIQVGDKVKVLVKSVSDQTFEGTITNLSPAPAAGSLTYPIKVSIDNPDILIKPGMFAEVIVASEKLTNVLTLPSGAVIIKGGKTVVATISADGTVLFKEVVTGLDNGELVEIKVGITENDTVVYEGQYYLEDGNEVNIIQ